MTKSKIWTNLAVAAALAVALGTVAIGADMTDASAAANPAPVGKAANVTLPDAAGGVASAVLAALTGGSNPSTATANDNASDHATNRGPNTTEDETDSDVSAATEHSPAGTTGTKPGWGCGDTNHTHSGPPGRPGASMPPGCTKTQ
jgi:hypothetical protein